MDTWKKNLDMSLMDIISETFKSLPEAARYIIKGESTPYIDSLIKDLRLPVGIGGSYNYDAYSTIDLIDNIKKLVSKSIAKLNPAEKKAALSRWKKTFGRYGFGTSTQPNRLIRSLAKIVECFSYPSQTSELMTKLGGNKLLDRNAKIEMFEKIHRAISMVGTPNSMMMGEYTPIVNGLLLFSNIYFQGMDSNYESYVKNKPKYIFRSSISLCFTLWRLMMKYGLVALGSALTSEKLFKNRDRDEVLAEKSQEYKGMAAGDQYAWKLPFVSNDYIGWSTIAHNCISKYDMSHYHCLPIGETFTGKVIYFAFPMGFTDEMINSIFYNAVTAAIDKKIDFGDVLESMRNELVPRTISPSVIFAWDYLNMLSGASIKDTRGNMIIGAGESDKFMKYIKYFMGSNLISKPYRSKYDDLDKISTDLEKILNIPGVGVHLRRFIRVSDYGVNQIIREYREDDDKKFSLINEYVTDNIIEAINKNEKISNEYLDSLYNKLLEEKKLLKLADKEEIENLIDGKKGFYMKCINAYKTAMLAKYDSPLFRAYQRYGQKGLTRIIGEMNKDQIDSLLINRELHLPLNKPENP